MISDATIDDLLRQLDKTAHDASTDYGLPLFGPELPALRLLVLRWLDANQQEIKERTP